MKKTININGKSYGEEQLFVIAGPCVIEDDSVMLKTADTLKQIESKYKLPVIYKSSFQKDNRSSAGYYAGPGIDAGLKILARIKQEYGFPLITDVHYPDQIDEVKSVVDVLQIPAYQCMQTTLVTAAAATAKAINLKHGQFIAPENMIYPVRKVETQNNFNIMLTERGYTFGYNDLIVDPRAFYHLNAIGYPVVFDITHSIRRYGIPSASPEGGSRQYLNTIARAGVAAGIDGLFIEVHPEPARALCDAASQMCITDLEEFIQPLIDLHETEKKYRKQ